MSKDETVRQMLQETAKYRYEWNKFYRLQVNGKFAGWTKLYLDLNVDGICLLMRAYECASRNRHSQLNVCGVQVFSVKGNKVKFELV